MSDSPIVSGRVKNKLVHDVIGTELELQHHKQRESVANDNDPSTEVTVRDVHRAHFETEEIFPVSTQKAGWKYCQSVAKKDSTKVCQAFDKTSSGGWTKGISFWFPNCIPKVIVEEAKSRNPIPTIECCRLDTMTALAQASEFKIIQDREYVVSIDGVHITFYHSLLVPSGKSSQAQLETAVQRISTNKFIMGGACDDVSCDSNYFDYNDFEIAGGMEWTAQDSLRRLFLDECRSLSERTDAFILYGWLGSFEGSIDDLMNESLWAAGFICKSLMDYGVTREMDSYDITHYSNALESLKFVGADAGAVE